MKPFFTLELAVEVYQLSKNMKMTGHLKAQYLRACSSIALNLSEGAAKPTVADRRKFYFIALGSLRECQTILRLHSEIKTPLCSKVEFLGICLYRLCQAMK